MAYEKWANAPKQSHTPGGEPRVVIPQHDNRRLHKHAGSHCPKLWEVAQ